MRKEINQTSSFFLQSSRHIKTKVKIVYINSELVVRFTNTWGSIGLPLTHVFFFSLLLFLTVLPYLLCTWLITALSHFSSYFSDIVHPIHTSTPPWIVSVIVVIYDSPKYIKMAIPNVIILSNLQSSFKLVICYCVCYESLIISP